MSIQANFFKTTNTHTLPANSQQNKAAFVNVGGNGDCGFRAVAAGFIDNLLTGYRRNPELLKVILKTHFEYWPDQKPFLAQGMTVYDHMQRLITDIKMPKLVQTLAYTFRQLAVNKMCEKPAYYRGAFVQGHEHTSPEVMRLPQTWIDETAIAALAEVLETPIEVHVVEANKELPKPLQYHWQHNSNPKITIQLKDNHYVPALIHQDRFAAVANSQAALQPQIKKEQHDRPLADILAEIAEDDKQLQQKFESIYHCLTAMVEAHELKKQDLLDIYIQGMETSDYLQGRIKYVGTEYGNQHFFNAINAAQNGQYHPLDNDHGRYQHQVTQELIHAIARGVSIGHIAEEKVFAKFDHGREPQSLAI